MWRCQKCNANLLGGTPECPVCKLPSDAASMVNPTEIEASSKFWLWLALGVLFPPLGLIMLLTLLLTRVISRL
jgi:hypothetical protein